MKSDKMPYIIYANVESLIKKIDGCANNPEISSTIKIGGHIPYGYSKSIWAFHHRKQTYSILQKRLYKTFL